MFDKKKTFRPKKKFQPGTMKYSLHKQAQASLNSGINLRQVTYTSVKCWQQMKRFVNLEIFEKMQSIWQQMFRWWSCQRVRISTIGWLCMWLTSSTGALCVLADRFWGEWKENFDLICPDLHRINLIYGTVCEQCSKESCPTMSGGAKFEYLWQVEYLYHICLLDIRSVRFCLLCKSNLSCL